MSCYLIFYKDGAKMMRPVTSREEYIALRSTPRQKNTVDGVRQGKTLMKRKLLQFNYSCLPSAGQETTDNGQRTTDNGRPFGIGQPCGNTRPFGIGRTCAIGRPCRLRPPEGLHHTL